MSNPDYNRLQIETAQETATNVVLPMLRGRFPAIVQDLSIALTGSASFGAADRFSDFDATVFVLDDDASRWQKPISQALSELETPRWAAVQDPEASFSVLAYEQWGLPLSRNQRHQVSYDCIAVEAAWHFARYLSLHDPQGHLRRATAIAAGYPLPLIKARSREVGRSCLAATQEWEQAPGPLSRWQHMSVALCDFMRTTLLRSGHLYPHEKWLWWWYSRQERGHVEDIRACVESAIENGMQIESPGWLRQLKEEGGHDLPRSNGDTNAEDVPRLWRDLWWQDNCLYHDIMRECVVSAFIRVGRCLQRIQEICAILANHPSWATDDLERQASPFSAVGQNLRYLPEIGDYAKWRYQIGYAVEVLRDALLARKLISLQRALKPFG